MVVDAVAAASLAPRRQAAGETAWRSSPMSSGLVGQRSRAMEAAPGASSVKHAARQP
jgi:hypothetical protein